MGANVCMCVCVMEHRFKPPAMRHFRMRRCAANDNDDAYVRVCSSKEHLMLVHVRVRCVMRAVVVVYTSTCIRNAWVCASARVRSRNVTVIKVCCAFESPPPHTRAHASIKTSAHSRRRRHSGRRLFIFLKYISVYGGGGSGCGVALVHVLCTRERAHTQSTTPHAHAT